MDLKRVEELIDLMRRTGVTQLAIELPDYKISIKRGPERTRAAVSDEEARSATEPLEAEEAVQEAGGVSRSALPVVSPVVGVFHNGGMLDPREIVREGDRVSEGQLIAAIEAMKVPNEVRAPVNGVVSRLLVSDGAAVEYGQPLLLIEPEEGGEASEGELPIGLA